MPEATSQPVPLGARIALWSVLALAGFAAVGFEMDRHARYDTDFAPHVPEMFRSFAQERLVAIDLADGENDSALDKARVLIARRPVPAEHLSMLAFAAAQTRHSNLAGMALTLAAERGWRDQMTQGAVATQALQSKQWKAAFDRLIALWSTSDGNDENLGLLDQVLATPEGRAEAQRWIVQSKLSRDDFLGWAALNIKPDNLALLVTDVLREKPDLYTCDQLIEVSTQALDRGSLDAAHKVAPAACNAHSASPTQMQYRSGDAAHGTFAWQFGPSATLDGGNVADGQVLSYKHPDPTALFIGKRFGGFAPGQYTLTAQAHVDSGRVPELRLECIDSNGNRTNTQTQPLTRPSVLTIPATGCQIQLFKTIVHQGQGTVSDIRIVPLKS